MATQIETQIAMRIEIQIETLLATLLKRKHTEYPEIYGISSGE